MKKHLTQSYGIEGEGPPEKKAEDIPSQSYQNVLKAKMLNIANSEYQAYLQSFLPLINAYLGTSKIPFTMEPGGWFVTLEPPIRINCDPEFFINKGYSIPEALLATFHEANHFRDMVRDAPMYTRLFEEFSSEENKAVHKTYPKAVKTLYNCLDDILVNKMAIQKWIPAKKENVLTHLYHKLFPNTDFSKQPLHRQFMYTLLREAMIPQETCTVHDDVRAKIATLQQDEIYNIDKVTQVTLQGDGALDPISRYSAYNSVYEPIFKELFERDLKEYNAQESDTNPFGEDPNADGIPDPIDYEDLGELAKKFRDKMDKQKSDENNDALKEETGMDTATFAKYQRYLQEIKPHIRTVADTFEDILMQKTTRKKTTILDDEGARFASHLLAIGVAGAKAGQEMKIMQRKKTTEKVELSTDDIELTIVCDGSGSMNDGTKKVAQQKFALLIIEAFDEFRRRLAKVKAKLHTTKGLSLRLCIRKFGDNYYAPLRPMSKISSTLHEIGHVLGELSELMDGNNEIITLNGIDQDEFQQNTIKQLREGTMKKIILFLTDGESDGEKIQARIHQFYAQYGKENLIIAGIGFAEGVSAITTYAPHGYYAEHMSDLPSIFSQIFLPIITSATNHTRKKKK